VEEFISYLGLSTFCQARNATSIPKGRYETQGEKIIPVNRVFSSFRKLLGYPSPGGGGALGPCLGVGVPPRVKTLTLFRAKNALKNQPV